MRWLLFIASVFLIGSSALPTPAPVPWSHPEEPRPAGGIPIKSFIADGDCVFAWMYPFDPAFVVPNPPCTASCSDPIYNQCIKYTRGDPSSPWGVTPPEKGAFFDPLISAGSHDPPTGFPTTRNTPRVSSMSGTYLTFVDDEGMLGSRDYTIGCHANPLTLDTDVYAIYSISTNVLQTNASGQLDVTIGGTTEVSATGVITADTWHHIVGRWSSQTDEVEIFVDGAEVCDGGCAAHTGGYDNNINSVTWPEFLSGGNHEMLECAVFSRALTDNEIARWCRCGLIGDGEIEASRKAICNNVTLTPVDRCRK